jgi:hypothetical protein
MVAMQAGGGGGAGSSGVHDGAGGGGGAAAFLIINIGKLQSIRFNAGAGGAAGQKSIDANTDRHGGNGANSAIIMKLWDGETLKAYIEGGSGGLAYSSNAGAGRKGGTGGRASVFVETSRSSNYLTASISDTDLTNVNYVGIKADGTKLSYPDTNYEAVFYVLKVYPGGDGSAGGTWNEMITDPIISQNASITFYPGITHTISSLLQRSHTYAN